MRAWGSVTMVGIGVGLMGALPAWAEDVTVTTYYPSPRGVYDELRTTGDVGVGLTGATAARLHVRQETAAEALRVEDQLVGPDPTPWVIDSFGNTGMAMVPSGVAKLEVMSTGGEIARFNAGLGDATPVVIENNKNVGIKTTDAASSLEVRGGILAANGLPSCGAPPDVGYGFVGAEFCFDTGMFSNTDGDVLLYTNSVEALAVHSQPPYGPQVRMTQPAPLVVGFPAADTTPPGGRLHVLQAGAAQTALFEDADAGLLPGTDATPFVIDAGGNVGIGDLAPGVLGRLFVLNLGGFNTVRFDDGPGDVTPFVVDENGAVGVMCTDPSLTMAFGQDCDTGINLPSMDEIHFVSGGIPRVFISPLGKLGVGGPVPGGFSANIVSFGGGIQVSAPSGGGLPAYYWFNQDLGWFWQVEQMGAGDFGAMRWWNNVPPGPGLTLAMDLFPSGLLQVYSDGLKPGGGPWGVLSDARLKHNIQPLDGALDRLLQLQGRTFEWNDPDSPWATGPGRQVGMVAQEVEPIFPEWVKTMPDGHKMFAPSGFEALTIEALRELKMENEALRAQNRTLEERVQALEQRLESE